MIRDYLYNTFYPNSFLFFCVMYLVIFVLSVIVYQLGFAKRLPLLKTVVVYLMLAIGCILLAILGIGLPIIESLLIATLVLVVARFRMKDRPFSRNPNFEEAIQEKEDNLNKG